MIHSLGETIMQIESLLPEIDDPEPILMAARAHKSTEYLGFVLAYRPSTDDYVTWLWNDSRPGGVFLTEGHYDMDYEDALMDFESRK